MHHNSVNIKQKNNIKTSSMSQYYIRWEVLFLSFCVTCLLSCDASLVSLQSDNTSGPSWIDQVTILDQSYNISVGNTGQSSVPSVLFPSLSILIISGFLTNSVNIEFEQGIGENIWIYQRVCHKARKTRENGNKSPPQHLVLEIH